MKSPIHQVHKSHGRIRMFEGHNYKLMVAIMRPEYCVNNAALFDFQLL